MNHAARSRVIPNPLRAGVEMAKAGEKELSVDESWTSPAVISQPAESTPFVMLTRCHFADAEFCGKRTTCVSGTFPRLSRAQQPTTIRIFSF